MFSQRFTDAGRPRGELPGLGEETVSRRFSAFRSKGLIRVHGRTVQILERKA